MRERADEASRTRDCFRSAPPGQEQVGGRQAEHAAEQSTGNTNPSVPPPGTPAANGEQSRQAASPPDPAYFYQQQQSHMGAGTGM
jgi:hypothetical protein